MSCCCTDWWKKPLVFKMEDIKRFPSESHIYFLECSGSGAGEYQGETAPTPQQTAGLFSCSEWTGVPLSTLLREAGVKPSAKWVLAEGGDASRNARSIPLEKAMDDVLVAYGQNGEAVRPEQGYPIRLIVPGWEGNINTKWLQRLHVLDQPSMTRDEAADYDDLLTNGRSYRFSFVMEAKSIVTRPAGGQHLAGPAFTRSPDSRGRAGRALPPWKFPPMAEKIGESGIAAAGFKKCGGAIPHAMELGRK